MTPFRCGSKQFQREANANINMEFLTNKVNISCNISFDAIKCENLNKDGFRFILFYFLRMGLP